MPGAADLLLNADDALRARSSLVFVEVAPWRAPDGPGRGSGSIPGAVRTNVRADFAGTPTASSGHLPLPDADAVRRRAARWRGPEPRRIVLYTRNAAELASATRAWFTLTHAGVPDVSLLHGGLPAWVAAGGDVGTPARDAVGGEERDPGPVASSTPPLRVLDAAEAAEVARLGTLLDGRPASAFHGLVDHPRTGHIPGAVHAPAHEIVDDGGLLRPPAELRRWMLARRALGRHEVAAYCGGGVASSALVFLGALLSQPVALYVDSWSGWEKDASLPVEQGVPHARPGAHDLDCLEDEPAA
ncbi:rhodanese-like domain-containing protein [Microbacterium betulae]|uniref:Rhodanese-like domain-containing protein n=1 Tax=Microbacterium betulae TaxID=2981139 RepID=A0AA97FJZ4_9MICO|nr:rhodanese-like domain-containing protein [Microbacterium sp. AB]WOF23469.1 rhodanese-like domain-containing protein [Microbacterium sp. AB]